MCASLGVEGWRAERGAYCERPKWSVWDWRNPYFKAVDSDLRQEGVLVSLYEACLV